jgi:hypothetical protein
MRSTWKIINKEKGKTKRSIGIQSLVLDNKLTRNQNKIADIFDTFLYL